MPTTSNILLQVPTTGSEVGTWADNATNPNFNEIDGFFGGLVTIGLTNVNVTLTKPTGSVSAGAGPSQACNRVLRFTGALSGNCTITLPLPGMYIVENLTTGAFTASFASPSPGEVIATPQGSRVQVFSDGTNVRFANDISTFPGKMEFLGGLIAVPAWIAACTVRPYLLADGSTFLIATYPALATLYSTSFGGDGATTSAVPDMRGRFPLAYDGTGTRITTAGCGINGQTMGAAGGQQSNTTAVVHLHTFTNQLTDVDTPDHDHLSGVNGTISYQPGSTSAQVMLWPGNFLQTSGPEQNHRHYVSGSTNNTGAASVTNVQPGQVAGIWLVKT